MSFLEPTLDGQAPAKDVSELIQQFMAKFHHSLFGPAPGFDKPAKDPLAAPEKGEGEDEAGSPRDKKQPKIPDLVTFLADVPIPLTESNQRFFFNLYLFALVQ